MGDSGAGMALAAFRVGHRVKRPMLAMDRQHGGVLWFRTEHILCPVHAGMVIAWMAPIALNTRMGEARWQTTRHVAICAALGSLAGLIVHPDIKTAARRARKGRRIPMHWLTYLCAWADTDIREHYERVQPDTYEAVISMTLFDNIEFRFRGRPLSSTQWKPVIAVELRAAF